MEILKKLEEMVIYDIESSELEDEQDQRNKQDEYDSIDKCITMDQAKNIIVFKNYDILYGINNYAYYNEVIVYLNKMDEYSNYIHDNNDIEKIKQLQECKDHIDLIDIKLDGHFQMIKNREIKGKLDADAILFKKFKAIDDLLNTEIDLRKYVLNKDFIIDGNVNYREWIKKKGYVEVNFDMVKLWNKYEELNNKRLELVRISEQLLDSYRTRMLQAAKLIFNNTINIIDDAVESEQVLSNQRFVSDTQNQKIWMKEETMKSKIIYEKMTTLHGKCNLLQKTLAHKSFDEVKYQEHYDKLVEINKYESINKVLIAGITDNFLKKQLDCFYKTQDEVRKAQKNETLNLNVLINSPKYQLETIDIINILKNHHE